MITNYLKIRILKNTGLFEYHVDFDPELESIKFKKHLLREHGEILGSIRMFDGAKLYLPFALPSNV